MNFMIMQPCSQIQLEYSKDRYIPRGFNAVLGSAVGLLGLLVAPKL